MLTGDNEHTAAAIARQVGVDSFTAALLPADQLAVAETQPDGTFHLSFSYSQITNKGTLKDITPAG